MFTNLTIMTKKEMGQNAIQSQIFLEIGCAYGVTLALKLVSPARNRINFGVINERKQK